MPAKMRNKSCEFLILGVSVRDNTSVYVTVYSRRTTCRLIVEDMLFHWNLLQGCTHQSLWLESPKAQCSTFQSWDWWGYPWMKCQVFGNCLADGWREKGTPGVTNRQDSSSLCERIGKEKKRSLTAMSRIISSSIHMAVWSPSQWLSVKSLTVGNKNEGFYR